MEKLETRHCKPCEEGAQPLDAERAREMLQGLPGWEANDDCTEIRRTFNFDNFHWTIGFVNAVAWIANSEDHHPELEVGYNRCVVRFSTHAVGGLSDNDFICAAKTNALTKLGSVTKLGSE